MPERKIAYEKLQGKSHHGIVVKAPSWQRLYIDAALALTDSLVPLDSIHDTETKTVSVQGANLKELMEHWLKAIILLFRNDKFLCRRVVFEKFDGKSIQARCFGEAYDRIRHGLPGGDFIDVNGLPMEIGEGTGSESGFFVKVFLREVEPVIKTG